MDCSHEHVLRGSDNGSRRRHKQTGPPKGGPRMPGRLLFREDELDYSATANKPRPRWRPEPMANGPATSLPKVTWTWSSGPWTLSGRR